MSDNIVYALIDPRTGFPRYVGLSSRGLLRPNQHRTEKHLKKDAATPKACWIRKLQRLGLDYSVSVLAELPTTNGLPETEAFWISELRGRGFPLLNVSAGGAGLLSPSPEVRAKMSAAQTGRKRDPAAVAKVAASNTGKKRTLEQRARISASLIGKKVSDEARRNLSESHKGKTIPEVQRQKISESLLGRPSPMKGRHHTEETRRQVSKALGGKLFKDQHGNVYFSLKDAANKLGLNSGNISSALTGRLKTTGGYVFTYLPTDQS